MLWLVSLLALTGLFISYLIHRSKATGKKLVCAIGYDCNKVIHSEYSKTFGVSNELLGMAYFAFILLLSVTNYLGTADFFGFSWPMVMTVIALPSALFSIYLTWIQLVVIKEWCEYCLTVATISISISVLQLLNFIV